MSIKEVTETLLGDEKDVGKKGLGKGSKGSKGTTRNTVSDEMKSQRLLGIQGL